MTIFEALTKEDGIRICYDNRWLVFNSGEYIVYSHKYGAKVNDVLIKTDKEEWAIKVLLDGSLDRG